MGCTSEQQSLSILLSPELDSDGTRFLGQTLPRKRRRLEFMTKTKTERGIVPRAAAKGCYFEYPEQGSLHHPAPSPRAGKQRVWRDAALKEASERSGQVSPVSCPG